MGKKDILSLNYEELRDEMAAFGEAPYRADQIYQWLHVKLADDFASMTNLSKDLRKRLASAYEIPKITLAARQISKKDPTQKFLFSLPDGNQIESVFMEMDYGNSVCISSQAGCRMGCRFCASAIGGWDRNLTASEMLLQVYEIQKMTGKRISHVVVMGTGEPLDNYEAFVRCIRMLSDTHGLNISQRDITASTCGLVPEIYRLAEEDLKITLALSLHSAIQEKREEIMPVAKKYPLAEVLAACNHYFERTGRRVTYEYSLMDGVNDNPEDVRTLCEVLGGKNCHLNLIPVNPVKERNFEKPDSKKALELKNKLEKNGINVTIRRERGADIDGACGQLRRRYHEAENKEK